MVKELKEEFIFKTLLSLEKLQQLHIQIKDVDISVSKLYPVTLVEDNTFFVFDLDESGEKYEFKLEWPTPMPIPKGVLAAFPLDFYNEKPSAIISDKAFNSLEGYIFIFHEFVHCYQWENGERDIRKALEIEKKYKEENNYMWEINHPFPYEDQFFVNKSIELETFLGQENVDGVISCYRQMRERLNKHDYEYMIWQEWKEGFARYIENLIRGRVGLKLNVSKDQHKYNRSSFYELGCKYIYLLIKKHPHLRNDIKGLYYKMYNA
jgi:hypothetical protein